MLFRSVKRRIRGEIERGRSGRLGLAVLLALRKMMLSEAGSYDHGKEAGLSQSTITNLFNRNNAPTIPTLEAVCRAFGITLSQFFSEGNTPAELTEEQRTLFAAWSTLNDGQKEALLLLMKRI